MDPQKVFCPNLECLASGKTGAGNIRVHSQNHRRYKCTVCHTTFAETKGTPYYRLRTDQEIVTVVVTLLARGCPLQAIVHAFGLDERTVQDWQRRAGHHCERVHAHLVERPRDLGQVQADELRVKVQEGIIWLAMAIQVSTRLWLGGVASPQRDHHLIRRLIEKVRACALCRPLLFCIDGLASYVTEIRHVFREPIRTGKPNRPRLRPWDNVAIAQVIKQHVGKRVVAVVRRIVQGTPEQIHGLLLSTQNGGQINTAYIERLNATFRACQATLVRRGRALAHQMPTLEAGMFLVGTVYNFCTYHDSLRVPLWLPRNRKRWLHQTPAIAAGITDHLWTVAELLSFHVPSVPCLSKRRGRPSKAFLEAKSKWLN